MAFAFVATTILSTASWMAWIISNVASSLMVFAVTDALNVCRKDTKREFAGLP
jgi:hypothetical protein